MSFFVVFDTCTHARYYGDVHEVLALPQGAVIRYEYKRRLSSQMRHRRVERLASNTSATTYAVLLMYGEKKGFVQGSGDPPTMLNDSDSVFVPTRSASNLIAVGIDMGATARDDVFYLHLQLRGFVNPDLAEIGELVVALEAANSLPFGDADASRHGFLYCLAHSLSPRSVDQRCSGPLVECYRQVHHVADTVSQDVFWRVRSLSGGEERCTFHEVKLVDRSNNLRVDPHRWQRDYPLPESNRYSSRFRATRPTNTVPPRPADDRRPDFNGRRSGTTRTLARSASHRSQPGGREALRGDDRQRLRYAVHRMRLETQVPNHTSEFPAGSMCTLTFRSGKIVAASSLGIILLVSVGLTAYVAGAKPNANGP